MIRHPLRSYFRLAFGITWGAGGAGLLAGALHPGWGLTTSSPLYYLAGFGPTLAGMIMAARTEGGAGVRRLLARAVPSLAVLPWCLAVIVGFPAATLGATWIATRTLPPGLPPWDRLLALLPLAIVTDPGPFGEEFGWRGFALPRLLRSRSPWIAAILLGLAWGLWHLPTFFIPALPQSQRSFPVFLLNSVALSVLMTWLYLRTRGNLSVMLLVHFLANYCVTTLRVPFPIEVAVEVACATLILARGGLRGQVRSEDPAPDTGDR